MCRLDITTDPIILFGEFVSMTASRIIEDMSVLNNELTDLTRDLHKKNREIQNSRKREEAANREKDSVLATLEERVAARTKELAKANAQAEAANQAKMMFLANMNHELRTPMNAIMGFTYLIGQEPLSRKQADQLTQLSRAADKLMKLIDDMIDISKLESDQLELSMDDFEPARIIQTACDHVAGSVRARHLTLDIDMGDTVQSVRGDSKRFFQVLTHLIDNAAKFTEKGGITVSCRSVPKNPDLCAVLGRGTIDTLLQQIRDFDFEDALTTLQEARRQSGDSS
jgi:signal transduction histidine kinase